MNSGYWLTRSIAKARTACTLLNLLILGTAQVWAQAVSSGNISGQVTDEQNAAVVGAAVRITDTVINAVLSTTTNDAGRYVISNITPATYNVSISKPGFSTFEINGQPVEVGVSLVLNAKMKVGTTATTIEVNASAGAELQTANASVGTSMSGQQLIDLPNLGRDVTTFSILQPGVGPTGNVAGAVSDQSTFLLDGGNNSDDMAGNTTGYNTNFTGLGGTQTNGAPSGILPTPVESVEEFKINTFGQTSDFNSSIGSQVQMVTKRGTNQWHGSAYFFYFGTDVGAANSWSNDHTASNGLPYTPIVSNHRDRFGGSLGGPLTPKFAGGRTYFFFNYEGLRFPNVGNIERLVPSATLRAGIVQVQNSAGAWVPYNLNATPVTVNGTTYAPATCPAGSCDPRGIGMNSLVSQLWSKYMPVGTDPSYTSADSGYNTTGFLSSIRAPLTSNTYVARIDHDFGEKNRFMATYRDLSLINLTTNQVDIGGALAGDTFGNPVAKAARPQKPDLMVFALTSNLTPSITNDVRFNYTRNFWQWGDSQAPPQFAGLGGALEVGSGSSTTAETTNALVPYNVNNQNIRERFWDGQDKILRDDVTMIHGNHLFTFGGLYQRNFDYHMRTDNGVTIDNQIVYQIGASNLNWNSNQYIPATVPSSNYSNYESLYGEVLGIVNLPQVAYTRAGSSLTLQPVGSQAYDKSVIPTYNFYFADSWHIKPTVTINYGLSYGLEMPPRTVNQGQVAMVDSAGNQVAVQSYLANKEKAALAGQAYEPSIGYALVGNVGSGLKYPYNPFYDGFSPRVSVAWNPRFTDGPLGKLFGNGKTVIRAGYGRIYGRLNGVNLVLVPLLGPGIIQAVSCPGATSSGACLGTGVVDPTNAFRIGTDGLTAPLPNQPANLPQPYYPGIGGQAAVGDVDTLDPNYKPERTDNFNVAIQRELNSKTTLEVGYVGRTIRNELTEINLDGAPTMMTLGGQSFASAFSAVYWSLYNQGFPTSGATVTGQSFFESALGGASSSYCAGYSSCTQAVVSKNSINDFKYTEVSTLWASLNKAASWVPGPTTISSAGQATSAALTSSLGYGNYNGVYLTIRARDYHGATFVSNFTWSRSLGTGATTQSASSVTVPNPYNLAAEYGPQSFDYKAVYNAAVFYRPPIFRNSSSLLSRIAGGWTLAPLFTAQSGAPVAVGYNEGLCSGCMAFGESNSATITAEAGDNAVAIRPFTGGTSANYNLSAGTTTTTPNPYVNSSLVGNSNTTGVNIFSNPATVAAEFRPCVLGTDTNCGGVGGIRGFPTWNLDASLSKDFSLWKENRVGATLSFQFTNLLNHVQMANPTLTLTTLGTFGRTTSTATANTPRNMEFGFRVHF